MGVKLKDVATYVNGKAFKPSEWTESGIPIIRIQNLNNPTKEYNYYDKEVAEKYIIENGDILISWSATLDIFEWKREKAYLNQHIFKVVFDKELKIDKSYFKLAISSVLHTMERYTHGSTMKHIVKKDFENIEIPLPPLTQQKNIAKTLDQAKELIELRKASIEKLDELSKSVFIDMFGDPVENPMGWEVVQIKEVITFLTSGSRGWAKYYSNEGEVFIRIQNVKNGNISFVDKQYINAPSTKEAIRTKVQENDLLLSITADLGRTGVVTKDLANENAYISQHLALLRLKSEFSAVFLSAYIETKASKLQFEKLNQGGTKAGLNFNAINSFKLFSPPLTLQNKFAKTIQKIESQKALYEKELVKLEENFEALLAKSFG